MESRRRLAFFVFFHRLIDIGTRRRAVTLLAFRVPDRGEGLAVPEFPDARRSVRRPGQHARLIGGEILGAGVDIGVGLQHVAGFEVANLEFVTRADEQPRLVLEDLADRHAL